MPTSPPSRDEILVRLDRAWALLRGVTVGEGGDTMGRPDGQAAVAGMEDATRLRNRLQRGRRLDAEDLSALARVFLGVVPLLPRGEVPDWIHLVGRLQIAATARARREGVADAVARGRAHGASPSADDGK